MELNINTIYKFTLPPDNTKKLACLYTFLETVMGAVMPMPVSNTPYHSCKHFIAPNQDGFIYCYYRYGRWLYTANVKYVKEYPKRKIVFIAYDKYHKKFKE